MFILKYFLNLSYCNMHQFLILLFIVPMYLNWLGICTLSIEKHKLLSYKPSLLTAFFNYVDSTETVNYNYNQIRSRFKIGTD